jgi:hypothetical protein
MKAAYEAADAILSADEAEGLDAWTLDELDDAELESARMAVAGLDLDG